MIYLFELTRNPDRPGWVLKIVLLNFLPLILTTWVVAANRRRLLQPEWGFWRTLAVHKVVGLVFALATAVIAWLMVEVFEVEVSNELEGIAPWVQFLLVVVYSVFVYVMFLGFMMWAESIRRVRASQQAMAREAILRAEAEAKAVRAQFNPHFVFNTLHSLMLLVRADPGAAERAIEDVAALIRYASIVQRKDIDAVALAKELEVARRYLGLERLRLADRLDVVWEVDAEAESLLLPAFALQTLVENAVKHGIEPSEEGGSVRIAIAEREGFLIAQVVDDGMGADPLGVSQEGHGLELLGRRLSARYGDAGTLSWITGPGEGFAATLRIPAERAPLQAEFDVIPPVRERSQ